MTDCGICHKIFEKGESTHFVNPVKQRKINPYNEIQKLGFEVNLTSDKLCDKCYWALTSISNTRGRLVRDVAKLEHFNKHGRTDFVDETVPMTEEPKLEEMYILQGNIKKVIPPQFEALGKSLMYKRCSEIAGTAFKTPVLQMSLKESFLKILQKECEGLCNKKNPSLLRKTTKKDIKSFTLIKLYSDLQERAPFLVKVLSLIGFNGYQAKRDEDLHVPAVCVAAATLLKNRNQQMNALQIMMNSIVQHSSLTGSINRLKFLKLTTSLRTYYRKLDAFGKDFDEKVKQRVQIDSSNLAVQHGFVPKKKVKLENSTCCIVKEPVITNDIDENAQLEVILEKPKEKKSLGKFHIVEDEDEPSVIFKSVTKELKLHNTTVLEPSGEINEHVNEETNGRKEVIDNFDIHTTVNDETLTDKNHDLHWVASMITENRMGFLDFSTENNRSLKTLENGCLLPQTQEHIDQRKDYVALVGRVIVKNLECLKFLSDAVVNHIKHRFSHLTSKPTETTFLGLIYENENQSEGIKECLKKMQEYQPKYEDNDGEMVFGDQGVVGDLVTIERAVHALNQLRNGFTAKQRCDGLHVEVADFHTSMKLLQIAMNKFYETKSSTDKCTLYSDKILINRKNLKHDVSKNYNHCKKFIQLELEARLVAAACLELDVNFSTESLDEETLQNIKSKDDRKIFLNDVASRIVDKYILPKQNNKEWIKASEKEKELKDDKERFKEDGYYLCRFGDCKKRYKDDGKQRRKHELTHDGFVYEEPSTANNIKYVSNDDDMYNYQASFMQLAMLIFNFHDSISEADGDRILRQWKFQFLFYKADDPHSPKYNIEAFYLLIQYYALLAPRTAERLIWNRAAKSIHGPGGNIPLDMALEHFNKILKNGLRNMGPNCTNKKAVDRFCRALVVNKAILDNFDSTCKIIKRHGTHREKSLTGDIEKLTNELLREKALEVSVKSRKYSCFKNISSSLLDEFDFHRFYDWIDKHKRNIVTMRSAR